MKIDRAKILEALLQRNALRREAHLPLLDVTAVYRREVEQARWREHVNAFYAGVHAAVLGRYRVQYGPAWGGSTGGRWAVQAEVSKLLRESFYRIPAQQSSK